MDASCLSPQQIATATRAIVLIISALAGVFCIYLGWRLYKDAILASTTGEATSSAFKFKFASAGPGVFFALFGMWLLINIINNPIQMKRTGEAPAPTPSSVSTMPSAKLLKVVSSADEVKPSSQQQNDCRNEETLVFFDGQKLDKETMRTALDFALQATALYPQESISGNSLKREQVVDALGSMIERLK